MKTVIGTYFNGQVMLEKPIKTDKPVKVKVVFEDEPGKRLSVSDFSFIESQDMLKDFNGSFSEEVIEERRSAL